MCQGGGHRKHKRHSRENPTQSSAIEIKDTKALTFQVLGDSSSDDKSRNNEKHIDPEVSTTKAENLRVVPNHE